MATRRIFRYKDVKAIWNQDRRRGLTPRLGYELMVRATPRPSNVAVDDLKANLALTEVGIPGYAIPADFKVRTKPEPRIITDEPGPRSDLTFKDERTRAKAAHNADLIASGQLVGGRPTSDLHFK